jgi:Ankyrin repeats (many copies)
MAALVEAVSDGDLSTAAFLLDQDPSLARGMHGGASPLHYAAMHGQQDTVDLLIDRGANLDAVDHEYGATPMGWANEKGHSALVRHMRARGARVSLHMAAAFGLLDDVKELTARRPDQLNHLVGYGAPLHMAALWGHDEIVEWLLGQGANPSGRNQDGELAMTIANRQALSDATQTPMVTPTRRKEIVEGCRRAADLLRAVTTEPV